MMHKKCNFKEIFAKLKFQIRQKKCKKIPDKGDAWDWMRYV